MKEGLSTREVAEIIGVPETRVRYWAQIGLVGPTYRDVENGKEAPRPAYGFADLVAARAARDLTEHGIPARRVREALSALRAQLPALDRPILHLRVLSDGDRLVVVGDHPYEPLTGQRVMDFQLDELSRSVAQLAAQAGVPRALPPDATRRSDGPPADVAAARAPESALEWFEVGLAAARAREHPRAIEAYRAALALDGELAPAHGNLGALLAEAGDLEGAELHLERALALDPVAREVRHNRAVVHEARGEHARALALWASLIAEEGPRPPLQAGARRCVSTLRARKAL